MPPKFHWQSTGRASAAKQGGTRRGPSHITIRALAHEQAGVHAPFQLSLVLDHSRYRIFESVELILVAACNGQEITGNG